MWKNASGRDQTPSCLSYVSFGELLSHSGDAPCKLGSPSDVSCDFDNMLLEFQGGVNVLKPLQVGPLPLPPHDVLATDDIRRTRQLEIAPLPSSPGALARRVAAVPKTHSSPVVSVENCGANEPTAKLKKRPAAQLKKKCVSAPLAKKELSNILECVQSRAHHRAKRDGFRRGVDHSEAIEVAKRVCHCATVEWKRNREMGDDAEHVD